MSTRKQRQAACRPTPHLFALFRHRGPSRHAAPCLPCHRRGVCGLRPRTVLKQHTARRRCELHRCRSSGGGGLAAVAAVRLVGLVCYCTPPSTSCLRRNSSSDRDMQSGRRRSGSQAVAGRTGRGCGGGGGVGVHALDEHKHGQARTHAPLAGLSWLHRAGRGHPRSYYSN